MTQQRYEANDPREWLNRALSNLRMARAPATGIYLEELCFNALQAARFACRVCAASDRYLQSLSGTQMQNL